MTEHRFEYDEQLLKDCAYSALSLFLQNNNREPIQVVEKRLRQDDGCCVSLFRQHAAHYGRDDESSLEVFETELSSSGGGVGVTYPRIGKRLEAFVRNVHFVFTHNLDSSSNSRHKVALNRFSDMTVDEVLVSPSVGEQSHDKRERRSLRGIDYQAWWLDGPSGQLLEQSLDGSIAIVTSLPDTESIISVAADMAIGRGSFNRLTPKKYKKIYERSKEITIATGEVSQFRTPGVDDPDLDGSILSIKRKKVHRSRHENDPTTDDATNLSSDNGTEVEAPLDVHPPEEADDVLSSHLNWATEQNPDGVPIVHEAFDQGACGSCWAFAAAGSLEASASRRSAYAAFNRFVSDRTLDGVNETAVEEAVAYAQRVERESFQFLNLSVQELVDCDTAADQGCTGGNPLLAFYFIHRYGLASWDTYPYTGREDHCNEAAVQHPIATAKSWGVVSPNAENHMELVLRYIGPIAVGFSGSSSSFLSYSGGIYDKPDCRQAANHALLVTGFGEEVVNGTTVRFWYARNSWGKGWGENGYVRVKRGDGKKGSLGVCGIARSPSVALGGVLLPEKGHYVTKNGISRVSSSGPVGRLCFEMGLDYNAACMSTSLWIDTHHALSLGLISMFVGMFAVCLLSLDCRKRRRRAERRKQKHHDEQERFRLSFTGEGGEVSPLLTLSDGDGNRNGHSSYGAT